MNTQSNAIPGSPHDSQMNDSQIIAPAVISPTRRMYWSVRRELWESRSIYIAPLAVAGLILFGFLISVIHLPDKMRAAAVLNPAQQHELIVQPYDFAALLIMFTTFIVAVFYCLDALYGERRDRSIVFWKSLPVSDLNTVLSKASIPLVVLPLLTFAITVVTQFIMLLLSTAIALGSGLSVSTLWTQLPFVQMSFLLLYHLVAVHALWYAPIYAWLLLVSGWARRAPFLWAGLPPLAIGIVEKIAFNTSHFGAMLVNRMGGGAETVTAPGTFGVDPMTMTHLTPGHFLSSAGLWIGLAIAAAFLAAAVQLRRYLGPI
ncbi:MAG: ABC transporter permease [Anaerolineales bacterium]